MQTTHAAASPKTSDGICCPEWCTLPPGHDPAEVAAGCSRIHYAPTPANVWVGFNDTTNPDRTSPVWEAEIDGVQVVAMSAAEAAVGLRRAAADIIAAAEWLEAQS